MDLASTEFDRKAEEQIVESAASFSV